MEKNQGASDPTQSDFYFATGSLDRYFFNNISSSPWLMCLQTPHWSHVSDCEASVDPPFCDWSPEKNLFALLYIIYYIYYIWGGGSTVAELSVANAIQSDSSLYLLYLCLVSFGCWVLM